MGDNQVRSPIASHFTECVDLGGIIHGSPLSLVTGPLVLSHYIFELLEVNPGVVGFLI